jgi:hypothetical protein
MLSRRLPSCQNRLIARNPNPGAITVSGRSFEALAVDETVLAFPAPLAERGQKPESFEYWWKMLQFVADLPDPAAFPALPMPPVGQDLEALERYIAAAEEMAESSLLRGEDSATVHVADDGSGIDHIDTTFTSNEIARGFTTLFRQFDADEAASFNQVQRILRQASESAGDEYQAERLARLTAWGRARSTLRGENLKVRVGQKLREQGRMPSGIPGEGGMSPVTLISVYQYGDLIHWTDKRSVIEAAAADPFQHAWQRLAFLEAVTGLAHLYIGFSLAVRAAVGTR